MGNPFGQVSGRSGKAREFEWQDLHNSGVLENLVELLELGAYVGLALTSDRGACVINVMMDSTKDRQYWSELSDEVGEYYAEVVASVKAYLSAPKTASRARHPKPTP